MEADMHGRKSAAGNQNERKCEDSSSYTNSSILGKRKKGRGKKHCPYVHDWLDNSRAFQEPDSLYGAEAVNFSTHPSFLWSSHPGMPVVTGQRLFTTVSDPSVCHYPVPTVPVSYAVEPVSLPLYSLYTPLPNHGWRPNPQLSYSGRGHSRQPKMNLSNHVPNTSFTWSRSGPNLSNGNTPADVNGPGFASLPTGPPDAQEVVPENLQRRFSDPGVGPSDSGLDPSDPNLGPSDPGFGPSDSDESEDSWYLNPPGNHSAIVADLLDKINTLHASNRRLSRALRNARFELNAMKVRASTLTDLGYQPGLIAGLVQEVREASRLRQEILMTKVDELLRMSPIELDPESEGDESICQRLDKVEEQLRSFKSLNSDDPPMLNTLSIAETSEETLLPIEDLRIDDSPDTETECCNDQIIKSESNGGCDTEEIDSVDPEKEKLQRDLEEALKARQEAEARTHKLEQLLAVLREKINVLSGKEKHLTPSEVSPEESLTSLSSSCGSPQLTMSGPVTCL